MIGKFEEYCLLSLIRSGPKSSAADVYEVLCDRTGKEHKFGAVYTTLDRMVDKKWVKVTTKKEGKRERRYFTITGVGQRELSESLSETDQLMDGVFPDLVTGGLDCGAKK